MNYQPWLPTVSLFDGMLLHHFDGCIEQWVEKWFNNSSGYKCTFNLAPNDKVLKKGHFWQSNDDKITAMLLPFGSNLLASNILDSEVSEGSVSEADSRLLTGIVSDCFVDLLETSTEEFGVGYKFEQASSIQVSTHDYGRLVVHNKSGENVAIINIALELMFEYRKFGLTDNIIHFHGEHRDKALSHQNVNLGAYVGNSKINLGELEALNTGDIIVLEKGVNEAIEMTVNNKVTRGIECGIIQEKDKISLKITKFDIGD